MDLAPITLFTFNRPWHTEQTLNALMLNELANQSTLYIYCDGPKINATEIEIQNIKKVRSIVRKKQWCKKVKIIERTKNLGLANNIINGVSEIISQHGKVIVLEDDIKTSRGFLKYMNQSLELYNDNEKVFHISGYIYPHNKNLPDTLFYNVPLCWGWATWSRAWNNFNQDSLQLWCELIKYSKFKEFDKFGSDHLSLQLAFNILGKIDTWFIKWH